MDINDSLFKRIENKTHVDKDNILRIASKLNEGNMKDRDTLSSIIKELSNLAGKSVSSEKEEKIINLILNDKVPSNVDKYF